jgi:14-3-3 protein epsilon
MKVRMADLWRPVKGVTIKEAKAGLFLFSFAHPLDMEAVINGGPWTFDNNMLIMDRVRLGMQIESIPLFHVDFWVQIHNLPAGFMKETVGVKLGNYIGTFMEYDKNNNSSFWRQYMRVRVKVDVRQPLKKDSKVRDKEGEWCTVNFKYEKLGVFCFVCGIMGHAENKCEVRFAMENDDGRRDWSGELRADQRRGGGRQTSRWLREERDGGNGMSGGERMHQGRSTVELPTMGPTPVDKAATASPSSHNYKAIITNNSPIIVLNGQSSSHGETLTSNHISLPIIETATDSNINTSRQQSIAHDSDTHQQLICNSFTSNLVTDMPPFYCQSKPNHNMPLIPTSALQKSLLPNNSLVFNSQPKQNIPPKLIKRTQSISNQTHPTKKQNRPDPLMTQPHLNRNPTEPILSLNRTGPGPETTKQNHDDAVTMEVQIERKRRREEKNLTEKNDEELTQHFLSAGPGSQDCREQ